MTTSASSPLRTRRPPHRRRATLAVALLAGAAPAVGPGAVGTTAGTVGRPAAPSQAVSAGVWSTIWGGQIAQNGGGFTAVSSSWTVPTVSCTSAENGTTYAWVGLGGWAGSGALEQIGTAQWCRNGTALYGLFGEFYSSPPFAGDGSPYLPSTYPVRPGDAITASVVARGGGTYSLHEQNTTRGWTFDITGRSPNYDVSSDPGNQTAEVIMEHPDATTGGHDYPDYGSLTFRSVAYGAPASYSTELVYESLDGTEATTFEHTTAAGTSVTTTVNRR